MSKKTSNQPKHVQGFSIQKIERSGPLPEPTDFETYEHVLPGAADRILSLTEKQQDHKIKIESRGQILYYLSKFSAQFLVLVVAILSLAAGYFLIENGHDSSGIGVIILAVAGFALNVIFGKKS